MGRILGMPWVALVVLGLGGCQAANQVQAQKAKPQAAAAAVPNSAVNAPQPVAPHKELPKAAAKQPSPAGPQTRTAFYRADEKPASIPKVQLSKGDVALCRVKVGDKMPAIALPKVDGSGEVKLSELLGKKATVVVFWKGDRRMEMQLLADIGPDVVEPFAKSDVTVVGISINEKAASAKAALDRAGASFPNLLDTDGKAFGQVGSGKLPRIYALDPSGKILWFDIEYSLATRRELHQTLRAVVGGK